jgi:prepilin-type N-terminal cleavage/methylation domain-containing protein
MIDINLFKAYEKRYGFTLIEVMISLSIGVLLLASMMAVFINYLSNSDHLGDWQEASCESTTALEKIVKGWGDTTGVRGFVSDDTTCNSCTGGWGITNGTSGDSYTYDATAQTITDGYGVIIAENVSSSTIDRDGNLISILVETEEGDCAQCSYQSTILLRN